MAASPPAASGGVSRESVVAALKASIESTHETARKNAEELLLDGPKYPGFLMTLLSIVAAREGNASNPEKTEFFIRQQASVIFKRTVSRGWTKLSKEKVALISDADKATVRAGIIAFTCSEPARLMVVQMADACGIIIRADCPGLWPEMPAQLAAEFESRDPSRACNACCIARCAFKRYGYTPLSWTLTPTGGFAGQAKLRGVDVVNGILSPNIGHMLMLAQAGAAGSDAASGRMAHLAIKAWFSAIRNDIPPILAGPDALSVWLAVCNDVIQKDVSAIVSPATPEIQLQKHPWWKAKKWAMRAVVRLTEFHALRAHATQANIVMGKDASDSAERVQVGRLMSERFSGPLAKSIFDMVLSGTRVTDRVFVHVLSMFQALCATELNHLFAPILKPAAMPLITKALMPKLLIEPEDATLAVDDPDEFYSKYHNNLVSLDDTVDGAIRSTLQVIFMHRIDSLGTPFLTWAAKTLAALEATPAPSRDWRAKEAVLHALESVARIFVESPRHCSAAEPILLRFCAPELSNPNPAMKCRALTTIASFVKHEDGGGFRDKTILPNCIQAAIVGIDDPNPAVAAASSELLMNAAFVDSSRHLYRPHIRRIMFKTLAIMNDASSSTTSTALLCLLRIFSTEVVIDAPGIVAEIIRKYQTASAASEEDDTEHAATSAEDMMNSIIEILRSPAMTPSMGKVIEAQLIPLMTHILTPGPALEFFDETCNMMNELVRVNRGISPAMWALFVPLVDMGNSYCADFIDSLGPTLDTYICIGAAHLRTPLPNSAKKGSTTPRSALDMIWEIVQFSERREEADQTHASYIIAAALLYLPPGSDDFLETVVKHYATRLSKPAGSGGCASGHTATAFAGVLATAILRDYARTLGLLDSAGLVPVVFKAMAQPVIDPGNFHAPGVVLKTIMLAMMRILQVEPTTLPASVSGALSPILTTAAALATMRMQKVAEADADDHGDRQLTPAHAEAAKAAASGDTADAADAAEFASMFGAGAASAHAASATGGSKPVELGEYELGTILDDDGGFFGDDDDVVAEDVDFGTLDASRITGDVPIAQVDTLLEFSKVMAFWQHPSRAAGLAHISAGLSEETKKQLAELSAEAADHVSILERRKAAMATNAASPTKSGSIPAPGEAGDPGLHGTLNTDSVHALAAAAAATSARLAAYLGSGKITPEQRAAVDRAAELAARAASVAAVVPAGSPPHPAGGHAPAAAAAGGFAGSPGAWA